MTVSAMARSSVGHTHRSSTSSREGRRMASEVTSETQVVIAVRLSQQNDMMVDCASSHA